MALTAICALLASACGSAAQSPPVSSPTAASTSLVSSPGATPTAAGTAAATGNVLTYTRLAGTHALWHPVEAQTGNQMTMWELVFNTLVKVGADETTIVPDLADSWTASPDATQYTFHLHPGVKWQDGQPFSAKDVVYTINFAAQNPDSYKGYPATAFWEIKGAAAVKGTTNTPEGLTAPDDNTIMITLANPDAEFLRSLPDFIYSIMPEHILHDVTAADAEKVPFSIGAPGATIGTGPYVLTNYNFPNFVQFKANPSYFKGAPHIDQIIMKLYADPSTSTADLESGSLNMAFLVDPAQQSRLAKYPNLVEKFIPSVAIYSILFNATNVSDKRIRQAIYYAINRAEIVKTVLNGNAKVLIVPPGFTEYSDLNRYDYNPTTAKQLLKDAGYDGSKPIRFLYNPAEQFLTTVMPIFQQQLQAVGMNVVLQPLAQAAYNAALSDPTQWDMTMQIGGDDGLGPARTGNNLPANCKTHPYGYANCALDDAFLKGKATTVAADRDKYYHEAALILNSDEPALYLWSPYNLDVYPKGLGGGFAIHPNERETMMNVETWTLSSQ